MAPTQTKGLDRTRLLAMLALHYRESKMLCIVVISCCWLVATECASAVAGWY